MKIVAKVIFFLFSLKVLQSAPTDKEIYVRGSEQTFGKNSHSFYYALSDGQYRSETGNLIEVDGAKVYVVKGKYSFKGTDGVLYKVEYTADEKGYRAKVTSSEAKDNDKANLSVLISLAAG